MSYVIRAAQPADMPQLNALQTTQCSSRAMDKSSARNPSRSVNFNLPARSNMLTLVCDQSGTLLGFVTATVHPMLPLPGIAKTLWSITEFCVPERNAQEPEPPEAKAIRLPCNAF